MDTVVAPSYATNFTEIFEETHIYTFIGNDWILYVRYSDEENLTEILMTLYVVHNYVLFDQKKSTRSVKFLYSHIYIDKIRTLYTTLHTKFTATHNYLHFNFDYRNTSRTFPVHKR